MCFRSSHPAADCFAVVADRIAKASNMSVTIWVIAIDISNVSWFFLLVFLFLADILLFCECFY